MKIGGALVPNIDFEVASFQLLEKTHRKTSIFELQLVKIEKSLARNARYAAPTCLLWLSCGVAVSMGEAAKNLSFSKVTNFQNWRKSRTKCSF